MSLPQLTFGLNEELKRVAYFPSYVAEYDTVHEVPAPRSPASVEP